MGRFRRLGVALLATGGGVVAVVLLQHAVAAQEEPGHGPGSVPPDGPGVQVGEPAPSAELTETGRGIFLTHCSSCHGSDGAGVTESDGTVRGPDVRHSGTAAAYYYLSTGRMPLGDPAEQPRRKRAAFSDEEIDALVAYIDSLGVGPDLPRVEIAQDDLAEGGELFRANCAPCHSAAGVGGALSYGRAAPALTESEPLQVAAAMRSGPGEMPVFGEEFTDADVDAIVAYVQYLRGPEDPGGVPIGRVGPIPEGFVAWALGMGLLLLAVGWIGTRAPVRRRRAA
ncbi:MAG: cytochrome bc1 complex diheme cytochrome c subunit [Acidimicrobiales bacterium]